MKELQLAEDAPEPWAHQLLDVLWQFLQGLLELLQLAWNAVTCSNGLPLAAKKNDDLGQRHLKPPKRRGGGAGPHVNVMVVGAPLPGVKKAHAQTRQQQQSLPPHHTSKPRAGHYHGYHHHHQHHQHAQQPQQPQQQQRPGRQGHPLLLSSPRDYSGPLSPADVPAALSPRGSSYSLRPHPHLLASPAGSSHLAPGRVSAAPHRQASGSSLLWHQQSQAGLLAEGAQGGAAAWPLPHQLQRGDSRAGSDVSSPRQLASASTSAPGSSYPVIPFEELDLGDLVGTGGFARVFKARWRGAEVAVKLLNPESSSRASVLEEFRRELAVLASLRPHPNIVRLVGACTQPPNLAVVTEYCSGGSLYALLHNPRARLGWGRLVDICLGAARGVHFLHSSGILHRDLKSGNLLLDSEGCIKLADFGLSRVAGHAGPMTGGLGTFQWMAPEVLGHQRYSQKADCYSFAILMYECAARQIPYSGMDGVQAALAVVNRGLRPEIPPHTPPPFARLMQACWAPTPDQRPEFGWVVSRLEAMAAEVRQLEQQQREREQQQWEAAGEGAGDEEQPLRGDAGGDDSGALCDVV